ncbi:hypothetical protein X733_27685 [Mesorhizobium sp. L2C067A000]|nr:hypothetical protein X733_27685 [Mesorhizobium sp. L2C067A000]ESZ75435.1 hypothetical protein X726_16980 [Mesorhizobium sp. L103C105A0]
MRQNPAIAGRNCGAAADSPAREPPQIRRMQKATPQPNPEFS